MGQPTVQPTTMSASTSKVMRSSRKSVVTAWGSTVEGADAGGVAAGLGQGHGCIEGERLSHDLLAQGGELVGDRNGGAADLAEARGVARRLAGAAGAEREGRREDDGDEGGAIAGTWDLQSYLLIR